jgi:hypothetical protein
LLNKPVVYSVSSTNTYAVCNSITYINVWLYAKIYIKIINISNEHINYHLCKTLIFRENLISRIWGKIVQNNYFASTWIRVFPTNVKPETRFHPDIFCPVRSLTLRRLLCDECIYICFDFFDSLLIFLGLIAHHKLRETEMVFNIIFVILGKI